MGANLPYARAMATTKRSLAEVANPWANVKCVVSGESMASVATCSQYEGNESSVIGAPNTSAIVSLTFFFFVSPVPQRIPDLQQFNELTLLTIDSSRNETVVLSQLPPTLGGLSFWDPLDVATSPNTKFPTPLTINFKGEAWKPLPTFMKQQQRPSGVTIRGIKMDSSAIRLNSIEYNNTITWFSTDNSLGTCTSANQDQSGICEDVSALDAAPSRSTSQHDAQNTRSDQAEATAPSNPPVTNANAESNSRKATVGAVAGVVIAVIGVLAFIIIKRRRSRSTATFCEAEGSIYEECATPKTHQCCNPQNKEPTNAIRQTEADEKFTQRKLDNANTIVTENTASDIDTENIQVANSTKRTTTTSVAPFWQDGLFSVLRVDQDTIQDIRQLGAGAFGSVWLVHHSNGRRLASKRLIDADAMTQNRTSLNRFVAEIKLNATLNHKNVIKLYGVAWSSVMDIQALFEFADNGDLTSWLKHPSTPREWTREKLHIAVDVVDALVYVHSLVPPLVHRDLKSRNVLLMDDMTAKLCDFGVSRFQSENATMTSGIGTIRWLAPEVIKGDTDYTNKADIYAFGVVLSELDTHQLPYSDVMGPNGHKLSEVAIAHQVGTAALTPTFSPSCPKNVQAVARRCLAFDPGDRLTAWEAACALREIGRNGSWALH